MKYILSLLILVSLLPASDTYADSVGFTLNDNTDTGFTLSYHPGTPTVERFRIDGQVYSRYQFDDHTADDTPGMPLIPYRTVYFGAPNGSVPQVVVSGGSVTNDTSVRVVPVASLGSDGSGFVRESYNENPTAYAISGPQPDDIVRIEQTVTSGSLTVWRLILHPLQYDPAKSTVYLYNDITVTVTYGSSFSTKSLPVRIPAYLVNRNVISSISQAARAAKIASLDVNPFIEGTWFKLSLTETGMYKVTGAELAAAGFPAGSIATNRLQMFYGGGKILPFEPTEPTTDAFREIAIRIDDGGDGMFDGSDTIVFYGEALSRFDIGDGTQTPEWINYPYADTGINAYWLRVADGISPRYIQSTGETPDASLESITSYRERIHLEPENYIEFTDQYTADSGIEWYWENVTGDWETFAFNAPDIIPGSSALLRIGFRTGMYVEKNSTVEYYNDHPHINYELNKEYGSISGFTTRISETSVKTIAADNLKSSTNTLQMSRPTGIRPNSHVRLDWLDIIYDRPLTPSDTSFLFYHEGTGSSQKFEISDVSQNGFEIYDVTDPFSVKYFDTTIYDSSDRTLSFQNPTENGTWNTYLVCKKAKFKTVTGITQKNQTILRNSSNMADYLILTPELFSEHAAELASWRSRDSATDPLASMVVDIADVYDEFSWGIYDPVAIRDFLMYATRSYNHGTKPVRYCCLFGDTTHKYKNIDNQSEINFIPTFTGYIEGGISILTDDFFTWFDENLIPEIATGRICAGDIDTAGMIVEKIITYERDYTPGYWRNRILLVADDEYGDNAIAEPSNIFTRDIEAIDTGDYIPETYERVKVMMVEYPLNNNNKKPAVNTDLFKELDNGCLIFNYIGHGNNDVLSHEDILRGSRDLDKFENGSRLPVFMAFSCTVGKFDIPGIKSLAEGLHMHPSGGSIASIAPSRYTFNNENVSLNKTFYRSLFDTETNPEHRIGSALFKAKQTLSAIGIPARLNTAKYFLFGDPATQLSVPEYEISFTSSGIDTLLRLSTPVIEAALAPDGMINEPITVAIKAFGPRQYKTHTNGAIEMDYSLQKNPFYSGEFIAESEEFSFPFIVPIDVESDMSRIMEEQRESKIIMYAMGPDFESVGLYNGFLIGDIDPDAPADDSGPSFSFVFDNTAFTSGDIIRRQPEMTLSVSDPSGINIVGKRGHNITLLIDGTESVVLTDLFSFADGYQSGSITYQLPILDAGEHQFEITAYDTYNNVAKKNVTAQVAGSLTGDIAISDLLNYPNPMAHDGTTFTFILTDYASYASLKIYSQAGRLVDSIRFTADYGFNQVHWNPPVDLANGVYFYKVSVTSSNGRKSSKIEKLVVMK